MTHPEQSVLDTIAELEAEENPDDITELVRWQIRRGVERGEHLPEGGLVFQVPNPERLAQWVANMNRALEMARSQVMPDAPYQEYRELQPGERVGWTDENGIIHVRVVREHVEDPPGSGNWTLTLDD